MKKFIHLIAIPIKIPLGIIGTFGLLYLAMGADAYADKKTINSLRAGEDKICIADLSPVEEAAAALWRWVFRPFTKAS